MKIIIDFLVEWKIQIIIKYMVNIFIIDTIFEFYIIFECLLEEVINRLLIIKIYHPKNFLDF